MITRNILITDASIEPVTDQQALDQLREDSSKIDLVKLKLTAARQSIEAELISLVTTQAVYELQMDTWLYDRCGYLIIPKCPLVSVTSILYDDVNNMEQTLAPSNYQLDTSSLPGRIRWAPAATLPGVYDKPNAIRIRYKAGHGVAAALDSGQSAVPAAIKEAILMRLGQFYEVRMEERSSLYAATAIAIDRKIGPFRIPV